MASRINAFTVHAWGEIPWFKSSATGNVTVQTGNSGSRDMSSMGSRTEVCRWIFIDEVEALGAEAFEELEQTVSYHIPSTNPFKRTATGTVRPYGGVNVILSGDSGNKDHQDRSH